MQKTLFEEIDRKLTDVAPEDIDFHVPRERLARIVADHTQKQLQKACKMMHDRVDKHMCKEANLLPVIWERLTVSFILFFF